VPETMKYDPFKQYNKISNVPSFFSRTLAFLLDISILGFTVFAPVTSFAQKLVPNADYTSAYQYFTQNDKVANVITVVMLFVFVLVMLYFILLEYFIGQTAGKRFMNLKVVSVDGERPKFWQCVVRNIVLLPVFPFVIFWVLDPLYLLFSKRRLSEQLSRTRTVIVEERSLLDN